jgi:hypothetical protein
MGYLHTNTALGRRLRNPSRTLQKIRLHGPGFHILRTVAGARESIMGVGRMRELI